MDSIGRPVVDSPFNSTQYRLGLYLDGETVGNPRAGQYNGVTYVNFPLTPDLNGLATGLLSVPSGWYLDTVARTNPSRPLLTPFTLLQDFVEVPSQLRHIGDLLTKNAKTLNAKDLANQNLALQFGWLPLVEDLKTLLDLQRHILRRMGELQKLYSAKGLRRRITIAEDHQGKGVTGSQALALGQFVGFGYDVTVVRKTWATIRWKPTSPMSASLHSDAAMNKLARKLVLGLTPEGLIKGTWDILPWTWLLGWFTNVGSFLLQNSNTVPATHSSACLMNESITTCVPMPMRFQDVFKKDTLLKGTYTQSLKTRILSGALTVGFSMPFVGINRLSILSSLYVQRFLR